MIWAELQLLKQISHLDCVVTFGGRTAAGRQLIGDLAVDDFMAFFRTTAMWSRGCPCQHNHITCRRWRCEQGAYRNNHK